MNSFYENYVFPATLNAQFGLGVLTVVYRVDKDFQANKRIGRESFPEQPFAC